MYLLLQKNYKNIKIKSGQVGIALLYSRDRE
jgi:hypothetical protein